MMSGWGIAPEGQNIAMPRHGFANDNGERGALSDRALERLDKADLLGARPKDELDVIANAANLSRFGTEQFNIGRVNKHSNPSFIGGPDFRADRAISRTSNGKCDLGHITAPFAAHHSLRFPKSLRRKLFSYCVAKRDGCSVSERQLRVSPERAA